MDLKKIKKLPNCELVFAVSCEEVYQEAISKTETTGRHKNIHCIFFKQNSFHDCELLRTIDFNRTHNFLFKSPRDVQQTDVFGRHSISTEFCCDCYKQTTSEPFSHFLYNFDTRTNDSLRFCSNIVGPRSKLFLQSSLVEKTLLRIGCKKIAYFEALAKRHEGERSSETIGLLWQRINQVAMWMGPKHNQWN